MDHTISVKSMLEYVENRVKMDFNPEEVAMAAGFSHSHFRAVFKNLTGMSLAKYISLRRLNHAAFELVHSKRNVLDIAMSYCYNSHDAFSRAFKREFGETPFEFRRNKNRVSGTLIVPGVFGPKVRFEEEKMKPINKENDCILYGVPKVSFIDSHEITPFISSLKSCLNYLGQEMSYAKLMAASGAAFRLIWNTEYWDGGNVDILCMRENPLEPVRRALGVAGRGFELLIKKDSPLMKMWNDSQPDESSIRVGEKDDFLELIKREIDAGKPLIAFGIVGPPEACIITGYKNGGEALTGWNFFQEMPEFSGCLNYESCGYFIREGWYEYPETFGIMTIGEIEDKVEEQTLLKDTLEYAINILKTEQVANKMSGFKAFEAWKNAILDEKEFPEDAPLPMLMERLMCQMDGMTMIGEGRWYASEYLATMKGHFPEIAEEMQVAIEMFKGEQQIVMKMAQLLEGFGMGEKQARNFANLDKRIELSKLITEACNKDQEALRSLELVLKKL